MAMSIARDYTESGRQSWHVAGSLATRRSNYSHPCAKLAVFLATNGQFLCVIQRSPSRIQSSAEGEGGQRVRLGPANQLLMQSVVAISLRRDEPSSPDAIMWLESICRATVHPLGSSRRSQRDGYFVAVRSRAGYFVTRCDDPLPSSEDPWK